MVVKITQIFWKTLSQNINYLVKAMIEDIVNKDFEVYKEEIEL
jgi:hypothetical protein